MLLSDILGLRLRVNEPALRLAHLYGPMLTYQGFQQNRTAVKALAFSGMSSLDKLLTVVPSVGIGIAFCLAGSRTLPMISP